MSKSQENPAVGNQQVSHPAGEATGSDLPPEGQGGPHLPDISEPTGRSLSEQFESGLPGVGEPSKMAEEPHGTEVLTTDPIHRCSICNGPDYQACGCEAKALQKSQEQDPDQAGSRMEQELSRDEILEKVFNAGTEIDPHLAIQILAGAGEKLSEDMQTIHTLLSDINRNLEILVKLQSDRADLLRDIKNAGGNQN